MVSKKGPSRDDWEGPLFFHIPHEDRKLIEKELGQYEIGKEASDFLDTLEIELRID